MVVVIKEYKKQLFKAVVWLVLLLVSLGVFSLGAYLILEQLPLNGRSFVGLGLIGALMTIYVVKDLNFSKWPAYIIGAVPVVTLYSVIVFCYALSNGLVDQERYGRFRTEEMLYGLAAIKQTEEPMAVQIKGEIGYSGVMQHVVDLYPLAGKIVTGQQTGLSLAQYGIARARFYYGKNWKFVGVWEENFDCTKMKKIDENVYRTIFSNEEKICVEVNK